MPPSTTLAPFDTARQSQQVLQQVLNGGSALADPRLADVTIYQDPVSCGPEMGTARLVPHAATGNGCPACPHPTIPTPLNDYLNQFPAEQRADILQQLATAPADDTFSFYQPTAPPPPPSSPPWWSSVAVGTIAVGLTIAGVVGVVTTGKGDDGLRDALRRDCSAVAVPAAVTSPSVACNELEPDENIQIIEVQVPKIVPLRFSFCDGSVCGDADPECASDKWMPQFAGSVPRRIVIGPLPGASIDGAAAASLSGTALTNVTAASSGREVSIALPGTVAPALDAYRRDGKVCGLTEDEYRAFKAKFGEQVDNGYTSIRIAIRWHGPVTGSPPVRFE